MDDASAVSMSHAGWHTESMAQLVNNRSLVLEASGRMAIELRHQLMSIGEDSKRAGWRNIFNMIRYRRFHRVYFAALALGLGVAIEDGEHQTLLIRINEGVGRGTSGTSARALVIQTASRQ